MATACSIIENKIIQRLADKGLLDNNINTVEFLMDMFVTKEGVDKIDDFLKDYNGSTEDKIESFIEDINSNPKIHGVANMLPTFKRYLNLIDNFQSIVNNSFNYNKTLIENLEVLLDKYYSSAMRGNPVVNILSEVDNVKNITYNEGQQKALQKLSTFTDKYLDGKYSERNDYFTMIGKAGTGKTTVICQAVYDYIKKYFKKYGKLPSVTGITSSHKAKDVLKQSMLPLTKLYDTEVINYNRMETIDGSIPSLSFNSIAEALNADVDSITNESLETETSSKIDLHPIFPPKLASYDIVIVDECSMLSPVEFEAIQTLRKEGSILIFMGDSGQLMPIITDKNIDDNLESYNRCRDNNTTNAPVTEQFTATRNGNQVTCNTLSLAFNVQDSNSATLTERMRSGENHPLLQFADLFWNDNYKGDFTPETNINEYGALVTSRNIEDVINKTADVFAQGITEGDPNKIQYVAYTNNAVKDFNQKMHNIMRDKLGKQDVAGTPFFIGEPIYLAGASKTGTKNNARGVIVSISDAKDAIDYDVLRINPKDRFNAHRHNDLIKTNYKFKYFIITLKDEYGNLQKVNYVPEGDVEIDGKIYDNKTLFNEMRQGEYGGADKWVTTDILDREVEKPPYGKGSVSNDRFKYANATKSRTAASGFNDKIMHGYATTIHKAQGSTFENVIINYDDIAGYKNYLGANYKNLMYTGITRAKNTCIVVDSNYKYNLFGDSQNYTVSENGQNKQLTSVKDIVDYVNRNRKFSIKEDGGYTLDKLKMLSSEDELARWNEKNPWFKTVEDYYSSIKDKMNDTSATFGLVTQEMVGKLISAAKKLVKDSPVVTGNFNSNNIEASGLYYKDTGSINLLPSFSSVEKMNGMRDAIHELLHLCSTYATEMSDIPLNEVDNEELKPIIDASAKLKAAFEIYKDATVSLRQNGVLNDYDAQQISYSHTNLQEFIAELSNPYVIDAIKKIDQTYGKSILETIKDFIQSIVNHIKSIFRKSFSEESLKTSLTHYYNSSKEYEGLLDMVSDAMNTLLDNPNSNLYKYNRAMYTIYENNKKIWMHNKINFPLAIENQYVEDEYVDINAKDFITRYGDFTEKGFSDKIRGIVVDSPFKDDDRIFYIDSIEVDSKSEGKKNIAELFLQPIDIDLSNEVLNVEYSGKNKVYKLKDINNPTIKVDKNELYLNYKRKERINYESEVEKEIKGILKRFNNFYSQYDINRFFLEYPFADSDILNDITDKLYDGKELTKDDYLKFKNNLGEHLEYPSSLSELGVEVVPNIENFATDKTKIKAYRIKSVDSRNPQVAFENKVMGNPFASWYVEQERIKKEKGDISKEDEEEINKFKVQDQTNFTQWLLTGDNSGNTAATKQLRDAYLSIIDNAANDKANNKVLYYKEVSPINSHAAAIQVIINNWDKIKENVAPFNKYGGNTNGGNGSGQSGQGSGGNKTSNLLNGFTIHSGGAIGSDSYFEEMAKKYGAEYKGYYIPAKRNPKKANSEVRIVNTEAELKALPDNVTGVLYDEVKRIVDFASESLDRDLTNLKKNNPDAYNLILRDYVQVAKSDQIIAVGKLLPNGTVDGGTGWAVEMARILNMSGVANRPIYVYNTLNDKWYKCSNDSSYGAYFFESGIPVLTENTAGIGTRGTEKVNNYVTDITQKQKEAIEQVFIKTAMTVADPSDWDSIASAEEREKIEKADELKKDAPDIVRNPSKSTNTVDISKNSLGATEFNIRRLDADKLRIEEMGPSGEFTVRVSDNNELSKTLFNTFKSNNITIGDLVRLQSKNNITILPVDDVIFNGDSIVIKYTNKQTINYSGKMMDISKQYVSDNVTSISDITQSKEIKHSIKQQLGAETYANRIKYLSRRFRQFCQFYLQREIDSGNMEEDTTIAEFLQSKGLNDIKSKFLDTLNKSIIDENNKELVNSTIEKWAQKSINSGQFAENERNEAIAYQSSVFPRKNQANRQISENFDVFFKDSLTIFCRENDIVIDFYTAEVKKKDSNDDSQDDTDKDDTTVQDAEYETVEKWQVGETHVMQSASTRLKLFLSNIPERGTDGKIKLDDIGEPIFLESNRVYNELQTLMSDCFTLSDLMEKLDNMAKKSAIYNSINKLINSKNNKKLQTELFILLNNEEIKYENWYSNYAEKGSIKKFGLKHENTDKQSEDTYNIVNNNIKEGINFTGKEDSSNFFRLNQSRESIDKNYKNTGEIRTTINNQYLDVIKPFTSQGTQFSNLLKDKVNGLEDVSEYIEMLSNKNHPQHIVFENALQVLQNTLSSLGMNISREELEDNCRNTSNDAFPIVAIMDSLYNLINEFSNIYLPKNSNGDLNDYINHTKGSSKLSSLCTLCPLKDNTANKQSVTYINGNNYPKFKALSPFGNTIKHIKDPNADRRNEWIQNEFKQYSWFYDDGNVLRTRNALTNYIRTTSNQSDIDIINSIITGLDSLSTIKPEYRSARVEYINKQFSTLSDTAKGLLTDKKNPKDGIISEAQWNNDTIERLMSDRLAANKLERHRVVAFNGNDYFKWDTQDFTLMAFDKFYQYGDNSEFADFLMPIYSDAGVMEFVTLPKLKGIEGCLNSLLKSYQQELGRIKLVKERKQWRLDAVAAYNNIKLKKGTEGLTENQKLCYNDLMELERSGNQYQVTDCKYYSLPIQNLEDIETINITDYNSGTIELKTGKSGAGNYLNFFSFLYNYLGNNIDEQKIDLDKVREYIQKELLSEADRLQGIINDNKYGRYNSTSGRYESYVYSENKPELFNKILEFCYQNMCANIAITELTVTDLAQYKDAIDFQKRFKEVYAGTKRLNTTYDAETNPYAREDYVQIVLKDIFDKTRNEGHFKDLINNSDLPQSQKDWLIKTYGKINLTDAQSYRSLSSMRAVMSMNGEWKKSYDVIYDKIIKGQKLTNKELMTFFQPRKPFIFTHKSVDAKNGNNSDKMKIGYQIKNSEFLLMYIYNNTNTLKGVNSAIIKGLNKFMEDNRIDCIHFNSGIKVGGQGAIDLDHPDLKPVLTAVRRDFEDNDSFIKECKKQLVKAQKEGKINTGYDIKVLEGMLDSNISAVYKEAFEEDQRKLQEKAENVLYYLTKIQKSTNDKETETDKLNRLKSANSEFVHIIPYSEYGIISSTPEHFLDKKQKLGTQLMRLLTSDNLGEYEVNGKKLNGDETFRYLSQLLAAKAMLHHDKLNAVLSDDTQLLNYFLQQMQGNSKYSEATMSRIQSFNEQGKLNLLGDPLVKTQIESLINSFIRDEINDVKLDGGTCIQVTAAFADDLHIKYTNDEKGNRIEYWECRMPIALKEVYNLAADKNGVISVDNIMKNPLIDKVTKEKLLQCIGCRVPTESKHSVQHLKCVEFLPSNAGSCIMLPYEITKTSGADFDIDKLYLWRPSFDIVTIESNGYKIKVPKYVEYKGTPIHKMNEKQLNNAIIDLFWSVLENPASAVQELYPNSYDMTQKAAYIGTLYHNNRYDARIRQEFQKKYPDREYNAESKFNFLKNTDIDDLQSWYTTGLNRCSLMNQSYFFDLNSKGKGMLGIMAVNNVFLSLLQHTKVSIKDDYVVTINGRRPYKLYETTTSKNIDGNESKVLSSLTLAEFLAAAPDSAKDPTLVFLGINNQNVNALVGAALLNYDIQDISLMFNHPVFKKLFEGVTSQTRLSVNDVAMKIIQMYTPKNDDGTYDYDKTNDYLKQIMNYAPTGKTFKGKDGSDVPIRELQVNSANSNYDVTQSDLLNSNNNTNSEIRILSAFFRLYKIGQDLNNLAQVTRQDSTSGSNSATFAGDISKITKIQRIMLENKKGMTTLDGAGDLLDAYNISDDINIDDEDTRKSFIERYGDGTQTPLGYIQAQLMFSLMNAVKYGKGRFPEFSPFLMEAYHIMSSLSPYGYLNEDTIKRLSKEFIRYKLFQIPFFGSQEVNGVTIPIEQKMAIIINETWNDLNDIKYSYNLTNNKLLKSLTINKYGVIVLPDAGQLLPDAKKEITDAWEELLNSPYDKVRMLGYNLIRYSFYRNGLSFAPNGFGHLCPDTRETIPGYVEAIESTYNQDDTGVSEFLTRFINNNAMYLQSTKKRNLRADQYTWINVSRKKNESSKDEDDNEDMNYAQENSEDIKKKYTYVVLGDSEHKDKYYNLSPAQIVPMTNLSQVTRELKDGSTIQGDAVLSGTSDFTYYPSYVEELPFTIDKDSLEITKDLSNVVANLKTLGAIKDSNDVYDVLQELKDNNELTLTTNLC